MDRCFQIFAMKFADFVRFVNGWRKICLCRSLSKSRAGSGDMCLRLQKVVGRFIYHFRCRGITSFPGDAYRPVLQRSEL